MSGENGSVRRKVDDAAWEPVTSIEMEALRLLELIGDGDAGMTKGGFCSWGCLHGPGAIVSLRKKPRSK